MSLNQLEQKLLKDSCTDDIVEKKGVPQDENKILTPEDIQHDVSILARMFINVYVGWPFLSDTKKLQIFEILDALYSNNTTISAKAFYDKLSLILDIIQDGHFSFHFYGRHFANKLHKKQNVGGNINPDKKSLITELRADSVAVIGLSHMYTGIYRDYKDDYNGNWAMKQLIDFKSKLKSSRALILDLRDNMGGELRFAGEISHYLCPDNDSFIHDFYVRINPDAMKLNEHNFFDKNIKMQDTDITDLKHLTKNFESDCVVDTVNYDKNIYILTNTATVSSAELLIYKLKKHPNVKIIGDNTGGALKYCRPRGVVCPHSHIAIFVGTIGMPFIEPNFELHGFTPDIKCIDGQNAFNIALNEIDNKNIKFNCNNRCI